VGELLKEQKLVDNRPGNQPVAAKNGTGNGNGAASDVELRERKAA
jgi:hypothetical protein